MMWDKLLPVCLNTYKSSLVCAAKLSTTASVAYNKWDYRKKWITSEEWPKAKSGEEDMPWLPSLPRRNHPNNWTQEKAYFGMYDNLAILGNDVTIEQKMFCRGPAYVRAFRGNELQRLIRKRRRLGMRMHAEDLHTINKTIHYLDTLENRRKKHTHG